MLLKMNGQKIFLFLLIAVLAVMPFAAQNDLFVTATNDITDEELLENGTIEEKMLAILDNPELDGTSTGVSIRDADTGEILYSRDGDKRLRPASNLKMFTGAAALEVLSADYTFSTEVLTDGELTGPVLHGDIYLKGKGDPTLLKEDLDQLAQDLKSQGISKVRGDLVGDDTWYDDVRLSTGIVWADEPYSYATQVSALTLAPSTNYNTGSLIVEIRPSENGDQAKVTTVPETDHINIVNNTEMVPAGQSRTTSAVRAHGTNDIIVTGAMPENGAIHRLNASVDEPTGYALDVFKKSLEEHGIEFIGNAGDLRFEKTPDNARLLTENESMPLSEIFIPFMVWSNNAQAEALVKEMGQVVHGNGTWASGLAVVRDINDMLGTTRSTIRIRDGSGMSHTNYVPPNQITQLLYGVQEQDWFPTFYDTLPVAGADDGSALQLRMTEGPAAGNVTGKTGSLTTVTALSGYVTTIDGKDLIFSVMINNYMGTAASVKAIEDEIAIMLAEHEFANE